jgi:hypothetical protein
MLEFGRIPSQHSHSIVNLLSVVMALGLKCIKEQPKKFMMETKNLLGGSPNPAVRRDSKQSTMEPLTVGMSTSGMKESRPPVSQPRSW